MDHRTPSTSPREIEALARRVDRPIVLVGMMGVGKSSVGRRLASLMQCPFVDADDEIEASAQMAIPEIFDTFGEDYFRDGERRVIARLLESRELRVIATGGGAFCNDQTRALILDRGVAVWLDSEIETLLERTARKDNRPLLRNGDPREILTRLRDERRDAYAQAPVHVISGNGSHLQTITKVIEGLERWV